MTQTNPPHSSTDGPSPKSPDQSEWLETLYERLAEDDEGRTCRGITEEACRQTPGNFFKTLTANTLTSVGDRLAGAKTVLPWLLSSGGAPGWALSLLVPIRESGSMLPQMAIGAWVRSRPIRKHAWALGSVVQGLSLLVMAWAALSLEGLALAIAVILGLVVFSTARGLCSVAYKDVLGKTIPKTRRGRLSGWISSVSGLAAILAGLGVATVSDEQSVWLLAGLLLSAAVMWFLAAWVYATVVEYPGETNGGNNGLAEALGKWALLRDDRDFRYFVIGRALAMGSGLAAPFYIALARDDLDQGLAFLGVFIAAEGVAGLLSAPLWGRWADRSSRQVFATACALAGSITMLVAVLAWMGWSESIALWFYPLAFFTLGLAHTGVRLGRKTYLVDMADGNQRTDFVAVSNTAMGLLLLIIGLLGAVLATISIPLTLAVIASAGLAGSLLSLRWKKVSG